ncbi:hypothetical protein QQF64_029980 [Cirrhinus molitorella]|uniref:Uncharacterized protein n=1 Tax=Cirrhinus molitorella TaxID=172907 RepID=A0ABR3N258_9TELE
MFFHLLSTKELSPAGYPSSCQSFLTQCSLTFELQPLSFPTGRSNIAYIITLLSDKAIRRLPQYCRVSTIGARSGWNNEALMVCFQGGPKQSHDSPEDMQLGRSRLSHNERERRMREPDRTD